MDQKNIDACVAAAIQAMKDAQEEKAANVAQDFARLRSFPGEDTREDYVFFTFIFISLKILILSEYKYMLISEYKCMLIS